MWKCLLIVALFCALLPVPRQAAQSPADTADNGQNHSSGSIGPTGALVAVNGQVKPPAAEEHGSKQAGQDKPQQISVVSIPTISVTDPQRHFTDVVLIWGPWVFNFLLVGIGAFQVWLLYRTWEKVSDQEARMKEQVTEMQTQGKHMAAQLREMQRQSDTALPILGLVKIRLNISEGETPAQFFAKTPEFDIEVKNFGGSPAFLKDCSVNIIGMLNYPDEPVYSRAWPTEMEEVVDVGKSHHFARHTCRDLVRDEKLFADFADGKMPIMVYGYVTYGDVFGSPNRIMKFSKYFVGLVDRDTESWGAPTFTTDWGNEKYLGQKKTETYD